MVEVVNFKINESGDRNFGKRGTIENANSFSETLVENPLAGLTKIRLGFGSCARRLRISAQRASKRARPPSSTHSIESKCSFSCFCHRMSSSEARRARARAKGDERLSSAAKRVACYHFFLCSSIETPPAPRYTTINRPPITDIVWKKSYLRKSRIGLYAGMFHQALK
jgi:hypothetical protein